MTGVAPGPLRATYSTATGAAVAEAVASGWHLGAARACHLLIRGINDCYALTTQAGRFVVRLSGGRARGAADVAAETAFLAYLDAAAIPVAAAVPARDGALSASVAMAEGTRPMVVFRHAEGRPPQLDAPEDAAAHGVTLARIHDAADRYGGRADGATRLDLDHLLHRPVAAVAALPALSAATGRELAALASRLDARIAATEGLAWTRCHGDCHGLNARMDESGTATFFDFDDGGFGYLAYDLAVFLWAQLSFGRQRPAMCHAFLAGYRGVRRIAPADAEAIRLFVPVRHIWLMGKYAVRVDEWGSETLSPAWLDREVAFLRAWERDRLERGLL